MSELIRLESSPDQGVAALLATIEGDEKKILKVMRGALRDTAASARTLIRSRIAVKTDILRKRINPRVKIFVDDVDAGFVQARVWVGVNPVSAHLAKRVSGGRLHGSHIRAGRQNFRGAFFAHIGGSGLGRRIWIRAGSKHYRPELYAQESWGGDRHLKSRWGKMEGRFPVHLAVLDVSEAAEDAIGEFNGMAGETYTKHFSRRLNYELVVKPSMGGGNK